MRYSTWLKIRRILIKLGFNFKPKLTFDELFIRRKVVAIPEQYRQLLEGCISLAKWVKLPCVEDSKRYLNPNLNDTEAYQLTMELMKSIIVDFARKESLTYEQTFQLALNCEKRYICLAEIGKILSTQIFTLLDAVENASKYRRLIYALNDEEEIQKVVNVAESMGKIVEEVNTVIKDIEQLNKHPRYKPQRVNFIDHLRSIREIIEAGEDTRWVDKSKSYYPEILTELESSVKTIYTTSLPSYPS